MNQVPVARPVAAVVGLVLLAGAPAAAPPAAPDESPQAEVAAASPAERPWPVFLHLGWDDGVVYEAGNRVHVPETERFRLFREDVMVDGRAGARLHLDAAAFASTGGVDVPGVRVQVRRAFLNFSGDIRTRIPLRYSLEVGIEQERLFLDKFWLEIRDVWRGMALRFGQLSAPFSLENIQSSNAIALLEIAQPANAFAPGTKAGLQLAQGGGDRRVAWTFGYYADTQDVEIDNKTTSPARLLSRVTWVPPWFDDPDRGQLLHLGGGLEYVVSSETQVAYAARPESKQAPLLLDTGTIDASQAVTHGVEVAFVRRAWRVQAEYMGGLVDAEAGALYFWGTYGMVSRVLTGEAYPYDRRGGSFGMVEPAASVSPLAGRWRGAWEVAMRYSYLDLEDGAVRGGLAHAVGVGLNWYWNRHLRLMLNYGATVTGGLADDGSVHVVQSRLQVVY